MPAAEGGDGSERTSTAISLVGSTRETRHRDGSVSGGVLFILATAATWVLSTVLAYCRHLAAAGSSADDGMPSSVVVREAVATGFLEAKGELGHAYQMLAGVIGSGDSAEKVTDGPGSRTASRLAGRRQRRPTRRRTTASAPSWIKGWRAWTTALLRPCIGTLIIVVAFLLDARKC